MLDNIFFRDQRTHYSNPTNFGIRNAHDVSVFFKAVDLVWKHALPDLKPITPDIFEK